MSKTWGQVRGEILRLGGEDAGVYERCPELFFEAVNRAAGVVSALVCPEVGRGRILLSAKEGWEEVDPFSFARYGGLYGDKPVVFSGGREVPLYEELSDGKLCFAPGQTGEVLVFYRKEPVAVTAQTGDGEELGLSYEAGLLVPLLAAFYVWEDEDERKALLYRNDYEDLRAAILARRGRRARVMKEARHG